MRKGFFFQFRARGKQKNINGNTRWPLLDLFTILLCFPARAISRRYCICIYFDSLSLSQPHSIALKKGTCYNNKLDVAFSHSLLYYIRCIQAKARSAPNFSCPHVAEKLIYATIYACAPIVYIIKGKS